MKEIIAIIRTRNWKLTKDALGVAGFVALTQQRAFGRGKQKGLRYLSRGKEGFTGIKYLPKRMVTIVVQDDAVEKAIDVLMQTQRTGEMGDGKLFVCPVEESITISSMER